MIAAKRYLHITFSSKLVAAIQQLQPTNPKKEPNFKTQSKKQTPQKKSYRKSHNNNQLEAVNLQYFRKKNDFLLLKSWVCLLFFVEIEDLFINLKSVNSNKRVINVGCYSWGS